MPTVTADMAMSLDGFVADAHDGMVKVRPGEAGSGDPGAGVGAVISGRRSFDLTGGWRGRHPLGAPVFVVTHSVPYGWPREDAQIAFVTDGIESALQQAMAVAGERTVAVTSPSVTRQFLNAGLLDRIRVSVVPVLLGNGVRLLDGLTEAPVELEFTEAVEGVGVTRLTYQIHRSSP
jgi:dihydrofolate reductase